MTTFPVRIAFKFCEKIFKGIQVKFFLAIHRQCRQPRNASAGTSCTGKIPGSARPVDYPNCSRWRGSSRLSVRTGIGGSTS